MKNGTHPQRLIERLRRSGKHVVTRRDVLVLGKDLSHPDRAIAKLVQEGLAEKLCRGVWLIPTGRRPRFDIPRFWSNPDLSDPYTISALVMKKPTMRDVARTVLAYGSGPATRALEELEIEGEIPQEVAQQSKRMLSNARTGFAHAALGRIET